MTRDDDITADDAERSSVKLLTDRRVLPSATTLRFAVLALMLLGTTATMYVAIDLELDRTLRMAVEGCTPGVSSSLSVAALEPIGQHAAAAVSCQLPYFGHIAMWALIGIAALLVSTAFAYLLAPLWLTRLTRPWIPMRRGFEGHWQPTRPWWLPGGGSQRLRALDTESTSEAIVVERVRALSTKAGLAAPPRCLIRAYDHEADAQAFSRRGRTVIIISIGMLTLRRVNPSAFDGIVLHELAHLRNQDSRPTHLTYAAWRAFVLVALLPYLVALIVSVNAPQVSAHLLSSIALLTVLTYLARTAVLRTREYHADARAWLTDPAAMRTALEFGAKSERGLKQRIVQLMRLHPSLEQRLAELGQSAVLGRPGISASFGLGLAASLFATNVQWVIWFAVSRAIRSSRADYYAVLMQNTRRGDPAAAFNLQIQLSGPPLLIALPLLVGYAILIAWRAEFRTQSSARRRWIAPTAIAMAVGYVLGEPLSAIEAISSYWGVVDQGMWIALDEVASATILTLLIGLVLYWAAEYAPRRRMAAASLRPNLVLATVVGVLGGTPVFFMWLNYHFSGEISSVVSIVPEASVRHWPLSVLVLTAYQPITYLIELPAGVILIAIPHLLTMIATRPPMRSAVKAGAVIAAAIVLADLTLVAALIACFGASAVHASLGHDGGDNYLCNAAAWIAATIAAITAFGFSRRSQNDSFSAAVGITLLATSLASPFLTAATVGALCGRDAGSCLAQNPSAVQIVYGRIGVGAAVQGVIILIIFTMLGKGATAIMSRVHPRPVAIPVAAEPIYAVSHGREPRFPLILSAAVLALLATATFCCTRYILFR